MPPSVQLLCLDAYTSYHVGTIFLAGSSIGLATATIESPSLIPFGRTVVGSGGSGGRNGSVTALALFEDTSAGEISLAVL
jgi:hypothetical protein